MSKKNYDELAASIIEHAGGKDNISDCYHCMSRLRLQLKDVSLADLEEVKKLGFIDAIINGSQLQVIAGDEIYDLDNAMAKILGTEISRGEVEELATVTAVVNKKRDNLTVKGVLFAIFGGISGSVMGCIPIMIGAGILKGLTLVFGQIGLIGVESTTYSILIFVGDSAFYFLPVFVGYNCAKKYGGNPMLGAFLGAILIHPTFIQMVTDGTAMSLFGVPVRAVSYSSTVLPAFLAVVVMCHVEKFIVKHSPNMLRVVLEPFGTVLIMVPLTLCVLAPAGNYCAIGLSVVLGWIYTATGPFAVAIIAALIPFLVMTGTHLALGALAMTMLAQTGMECVLMPAALLHNFVHGALALAIAIKTKNKDLKASAFSFAFTAWVAGISEPSLYGLFFKFKSAMVSLMIGSFCGALYYGITGTGIYTMIGGGMAFLSLASYIGADTANFVNAVIGTAIGMAVTFVMALILYSDKKEGVSISERLS